MCSDDSLFVQISAFGNFYAAPNPNKFIVELSDLSGSFQSPHLLETINDAPKILKQYFKTYKIPAGLPNGTGYRVRVTSTSPDVTGLSNALGLLFFKVTPTAPSITNTSDYECIGTDGWTNYYSSNGTPTNYLDDILLLSIKKNGNNIGNAGPGVTTMAVIVSTTAAAGSNTAVQITDPSLITQYWSMNRYWQVITLTQPTSKVDVRFYYNEQDLYDVNGSQPGSPVDHTKLVFFKTDKPDPSTNFAGNTYINSYVHENGLTIPGVTWKHTDLGGDIHMAEFAVDSFSGGGGGITLSGGPLTITKTFSIKSGNWNDPATWSTGTVPTDATDVVVQHDVIVNINAGCKTIKIQSPGKITVNTGLNLKVFK
jgi:hypothetical protein